MLKSSKWFISVPSVTSVEVCFSKWRWPNQITAILTFGRWSPACEVFKQSATQRNGGLDEIHPDEIWICVYYSAYSDMTNLTHVLHIILVWQQWSSRVNWIIAKKLFILKKQQINWRSRKGKLMLIEQIDYVKDGWAILINVE